MIEILKVSHRKIARFKPRSIATIIISSLLFGTVLGGLLLAAGIEENVIKYSAPNDLSVIQRNFDKLEHNFIIPAIVVVLIAAILISAFTLAHVLAEDRKTFMLYRSLGASSTIIARIYLAYLLELCLYTAILAAIFSFMSAAVFSFAFRSALLSQYPSLSDASPILIKFDYHFLIVLPVIFITAPLALLLNLDQFSSKKIATLLKENS